MAGTGLSADPAEYRTRLDEQSDEQIDAWAAELMGADGAVSIIFKDAIDAADDPVAERQRLVADYEAGFANPYVAAARGYVDEVIKPSETRPRLIRALEVLQDKRDTNPRKKHGNIPL